jgi:hypothetical protein
MDLVHMTGKLQVAAIESHVSRKTSEIWGANTP